MACNMLVFRMLVFWYFVFASFLHVWELFCKSVY
nr:MAG TPA: hypothetical protein [Caudoviricetes sp.]